MLVKRKNDRRDFLKITYVRPLTPSCKVAYGNSDGDPAFQTEINDVVSTAIMVTYKNIKFFTAERK
jgi:hypothetical protein